MATTCPLGNFFTRSAWYLSIQGGIIPVMDTTGPEFNAAVATVLNMEKTGQKVTLEQLEEATGFKKVSLQRYLSGTRVMNMAQVRAIAAVLGMDVPEVYAEAERWLARQAARDQRQSPPAPAQPRQAGGGAA
jgi:protein-disulfide isomerase-like protein with CxxC motif